MHGLFSFWEVLFRHLHMNLGWLTLGRQAWRIVWCFEMFTAFKWLFLNFSWSKKNSASSFSVVFGNYRYTFFNTFISIQQFCMSNSNHQKLCWVEVFFYLCFFFLYILLSSIIKKVSLLFMHRGRFTIIEWLGLFSYTFQHEFSISRVVHA